MFGKVPPNSMNTLSLLPESTPIVLLDTVNALSVKFSEVTYPSISNIFLFFTTQSV